MTQVRHLTTKETAQILRRVLRREFPGVKFSVRCTPRSPSIRVGWADGPIADAAREVADRYEGGRFDPSIDLTHYRTHWLRPDDSVLVYHDPGTVGNGGGNPGEDNRALATVIPDDAELVSFGATYIHCDRTISDYDAKTDKTTAWLYEHVEIGCPQSAPTGDPMKDYLHGMPVRHLAAKMVRCRADGESMMDVYRRMPYGYPPINAAALE